MNYELYLCVMLKKLFYAIFVWLYGYVTYSMRATSFNHVAFWEHLVPLKHTNIVLTITIVFGMFCIYAKLFCYRVHQCL